VLVHHIDENPTNNTFGNLAVLCLDCHCKAQNKGSSGPQLDASFVTKARDEWLSKLELRRDISTQVALTRQVTDISLSEQVEVGKATVINDSQMTEPLIDYIRSLPLFKEALVAQGKTKWESADTQTIVQANYDYIDSLKGVLVTLADCYLPEQFEIQTPQEYFLELISSRFKWHRIITGPNRAATAVNLICGQAVIVEVEKMIEEMVLALVASDNDSDSAFDKKDWLTQWQR